MSTGVRVCPVPVLIDEMPAREAGRSTCSAVMFHKDRKYLRKCTHLAILMLKNTEIDKFETENWLFPNHHTHALWRKSRGGPLQVHLLLW